MLSLLSAPRELRILRTLNRPSRSGDAVRVFRFFLFFPLSKSHRSHPGSTPPPGAGGCGAVCVPWCRSITGTSISEMYSKAGSSLIFPYSLYDLAPDLQPPLFFRRFSGLCKRWLLWLVHCSFSSVLSDIQPVENVLFADDLVVVQVA